MSRPIAFTTADGTIDAQVFTPTGAGAGGDAAGPLPGVVLFTDIGGVRPAFEERAQALADAGYAVLLPNIYYRTQPGRMVPEGKRFVDPEVMGTLFAEAAKLTAAAQAIDFAALLDGIDAAPEFAAGPVGVVGYCMTVAFSLRMAALQPERVAAAAGFHGAWLAADGDADSVVHTGRAITARVFLGHADKDEHLPAEQIARVDRALAEGGVHFTTELFAGAMHGFAVPDAPAHDAAADALHMKRLLTLLGETLPRAEGER